MDEVIRSTPSVLSFLLSSSDDVALLSTAMDASTTPLIKRDRCTTPLVRPSHGTSPLIRTNHCNSLVVETSDLLFRPIIINDGSDNNQNCYYYDVYRFFFF